MTSQIWCCPAGRCICGHETVEHHAHHPHKCFERWHCKCEGLRLREVVASELDEVLKATIP